MMFVDYLVICGEHKKQVEENLSVHKNRVRAEPVNSRGSKSVVNHQNLMDNKVWCTGLCVDKYQRYFRMKG